MTPSPPQPSPARTRGLLEILLLAGVLYIILGAPGLSSLSTLSLPSLLPSISNSPPPHHDTTAQPREKLQSVVYPTPSLPCPPHHYTTHILSLTPLVLYIPSFLSPTEVSILKNLSLAATYQPSTLFTSSRESHDPTIRLSEKSLLPRTEVVRCIEARALALQGWPKYTFIERLWTQRYNVSGHYKLHYDWGAASARARRASSFMVYLSGGEDDAELEGREGLEGGGTHFPRLRHPVDFATVSEEGEEGERARRRVEEEWCKYIACPSSESSDSSSIPADGVTFLPISGNAVFWQNFDAAGRGYKETLHAGLPVTKGQKIGLNIWSWYQAGHEAPLDGEEEDGDGDGDGEDGQGKEEL